MSATCNATSCIKPVKARGLCAAHYAKWNRRNRGSVQPRSPNGAGTVRADGYIRIGRRMAHHLVAEKALGRPLPPGAVVHHVNEDRTDNRPDNLVICPDNAYHRLLHARMDAFEATGDPRKRRCRLCHQYDDIERLSASTAGRPSKMQYVHKECRNEYQRNKR